MTEEHDEQNNLPLTIKESRFYKDVKSSDFFKDKIPDIGVQMAVESTFDTDLSRSEEEKDDTRVFIHYSDEEGNKNLIKLVYTHRDNYLDGTFNIDGLLEDFDIKVFKKITDELPSELKESVPTQSSLFLSEVCLNLSIGEVISSVTSDKSNDNFCEGFIDVFTHIVFEKAKDVIVIGKIDDDFNFDLEYMWAVKYR